jgi:hypothetical protein
MIFFGFPLAFRIYKGDLWEQNSGQLRPVSYDFGQREGGLAFHFWFVEYLISIPNKFLLCFYLRFDLMQTTGMNLLYYNIFGVFKSPKLKGGKF